MNSPVIGHAVVLGSSEIITSEDLPETFLETDKSELSLTRYHERVKDARCLIITSAIRSGR
jgi:hypothetical protein